MINYSLRDCFFSLFHRGIFASAREIYQESGLSGFFQGMVPRLTGELLALVLASSVSFTISTYIIGDPRYKPTVKTAIGVSANFFATIKLRKNKNIFFPFASS